MMFDDMLKQYDMDIPNDDVKFIKALIAGDKARCRSVRTRVYAPGTQPYLEQLPVTKSLSYSRSFPTR